jgi:hypothetical protein
MSVEVVSNSRWLYRPLLTAVAHVVCTLQTEAQTRLHDSHAARLEIVPWLEAARCTRLGSVVDNFRVLECLGLDHNSWRWEVVLLEMYVSGLMGSVAAALVALAKTW